MRGLKQAARNANDGVSLIQTAEGSMNEISNILIRMRELGVQAASDTIGDDERGFLDKEVQQLKQEVQRISEVTAFNGRALLNGSLGDVAFQVGAHKGDNQRIVFNGKDNSSTLSSLGVGGVGVASKDDALDSLESIDGAIGKINGSRAEFGAIQNRLHSAATSIGVNVEAMSSARSRIADTDIAEETSNLVKNSILQDASVAVLAQANQSPSKVLRLL